jgi:hypothetical protein
LRAALGWREGQARGTGPRAFTSYFFFFAAGLRFAAPVFLAVGFFAAALLRAAGFFAAGFFFATAMLHPSYRAG